MQQNPPRFFGRPVFFGWIVILGLTYVTLIGSGVIFYAQSIYLAAYVQHTSFSVANISFGNTVFMLGSALSGLLIGNIVQRIDIRWIFGIGVLATLAVLQAMPHAHSLTEIYIIYAAMGVAFSCISLVPINILVARWFVARRAFALSLAHSGLSLGGIMVTPILAQGFTQYGFSALQSPFIWILCLAALPIILLLRAHPQDMGLHADGATEDIHAEIATQGMEMRDVIRTRFFILIILASLLALTAQVGTIAHVFRWSLERADANIAALSLMLVSLFSFSARLVFGRLMDKFPIYKGTIIIFALQFMALGLFAYAEGALAVIIATCLFGATVGIVLMSAPLLLGQAFGMKNYPRIIGMSQLFTSFGMAIGAFFLGVIYDLANGYESSFLVASGAALLATIFLILAGNPDDVMASENSPVQ